MASGSQSLGTGYNNASVQGLSLISGATGGSPQGIYDESSTQEYPLGQLREFEDGRKFRYAKASAAITASKTVSTDSVQLVAASDLLNAVWTAAAAGSTSLTVTDADLGSATANLYAGAYLGNLTNKEQYRIKSNTAASSNAVTLELYDGIVTAFAASDDSIITPNPYGSVITATVTDGAYDRVVGIAPIAVTSGYYFWLQVAGVALAIAEGGITMGTGVSIGNDVAGSVQIFDQGIDEVPLGVALGIAADTASVPIMLNISG